MSALSERGRNAGERLDSRLQASGAASGPRSESALSEREDDSRPPAGCVPHWSGPTASRSESAFDAWFDVVFFAVTLIALVLAAAWGNWLAFGTGTVALVLYVADGERG